MGICKRQKEKIAVDKEQKSMKQWLERGREYTYTQTKENKNSFKGKKQKTVGTNYGKPV
jgi:hypothetical protein